MDLIVHKYSSLPSTNQKAFELALNGAAHGEVVLADSQSAGRGRLGKAWQSPAGKGLYFSLIIRPDLPLEDFPKITMTTGLAIAKTLERICHRDVYLKWPNDIFISGRKCCGILAEASLPPAESEARFAVVGVGMNIFTQEEDFPDALKKSATSLLIETGERFEMDELLSSLCNTIIDHVAVLEAEDFVEILRQWKTRDFLLGKWLEWVTNSGEIIEGRAEGPDDNGQLIVRDQKGVLHEVISGDITIAGSV